MGIKSSQEITIRYSERHISDTSSVSGTWKLAVTGLSVQLGVLHGLMQNESLPLNGQCVKGRWQHPLQVCALQQSSSSRALGGRESSLSTAFLPGLGSYQLWHAPRSDGGWRNCKGEATEASCRQHHLF